MLQSFAINTVELAAWYCDWKGIEPSDKMTTSASHMPEVSVDELLQSVGVYKSQLPEVRKVGGRHDHQPYGKTLVSHVVTFGL